MTPKTICVLGGTGFVGHHLISRLTQAGYDVRVPSRNRERHRSLLVLPNVEVIDCNIFDENQLQDLLKGCDAVVNLVAILSENKKGGFEKVHVELPATLAKACWAAGVSRVLHMSALNADAKSGGSAYLRTKGAGEDTIHDSDGLNVTSFRPSVMFGSNDAFFNTFADLLVHLPAMPVMCPDSRLAPVFIDNVVDVMVKSLNDPRTFGQRYDLCGPKSYTLLELVKYVGRMVKPKRRIIPLGDGLSALMARVLGMMPGSKFSHDNFLSLQTPSVCQGPFPAHFNITPTPIEIIVPLYAGRADIRSRYDTLRQHAARDAE